MRADDGKMEETVEERQAIWDFDVFGISPLHQIWTYEVVAGIGESPWTSLAAQLKCLKVFSVDIDDDTVTVLMVDTIQRERYSLVKKTSAL